ncbi:hypothetical protein [Pedobacter frigiditerrae]|uniref:hypothetical protein n=1 Tax=Pedobacter frigiditerrae TaxID=2530452 RepID=UPI00292EE315|nr:hypothetical protein [Pedobacter frigiditerrae]
MIRKILAVIVGYIIFAATALAFFKVFDIEAHSVASTTVMIQTAINGIIFSALAGWITQLIAKTGNLKINYILALLIAAFATFSFFKASGEHWTQLMAIFIFAPVSIVGGWIVVRRK